MRVRQDNAATHQAVAEVVQTGEKLVADRLTLLRHDVMDEVRKVTAHIVPIALSAVFGLAAFVILTIGLGMSLAEILPGYQAALCLGGAYGGIALGLGMHIKRSSAQAQQEQQTDAAQRAHQVTAP